MNKIVRIAFLFFIFSSIISFQTVRADFSFIVVGDEFNFRGIEVAYEDAKLRDPKIKERKLGVQGEKIGTRSLGPGFILKIFFMINRRNNELHMKKPFSHEKPEVTNTKKTLIIICVVMFSACFFGNALALCPQIRPSGMLYCQDFEHDGWQDDFTGRATWEDHVSRINSKCHSGNHCLRGNQLSGTVDPLTGLEGTGNPLLDWRGSGHDIDSRTPHEMFFSYWFRHDDFDYPNSTNNGEGKLLYFIDPEYSVRAMYIGGQLCKRNQLSVRYGNGGYGESWAYDNWGSAHMYLSNPDAPPSCNGEWRHFEYYINYDEHYFKIWIDGYILYPSHSANSKYWEQYPQEASEGKILYDPGLNIHWRGFQLFYASTGDGRDFNNCVNQEGYCVGWQIDDLEVWNTKPETKAPEITSFSGDFVHNKTITIHGNGFGNSSFLKYDDFENGEDGEILKNWDLHFYGGNAPVPPRYSNRITRKGSTMSAEVNFDNQYRSDFGFDRNGSREFYELFLSFYAYLDFRGELSRNYKIFRAYSGAPDDHSVLTLTTFPRNIGNSWLFAVNGEANYVFHYVEDEWKHYEIWLKLYPDHAEGSFWYDGQLRNFTLPADTSGHGMDELRLGHYLADDLKICTEPDSPHYLEDCGICADGSWTTPCYSDFCQGTCAFSRLGCDSRGGCNGSVYFDDVYFAQSRARIEICDQPVWDERKHCEIQIPVSWSNNSITFTANQGSFQPGEQAYLFVIDENGTASDGYPITFENRTKQCLNGKINKTCICKDPKTEESRAHSMGYCYNGYWHNMSWNDFVVFEDGFENDSLSKWSYVTGEGTTVTVTDKKSYIGNKSCRIYYSLPAEPPEHRDSNRFIQKDMTDINLEHFFIKGSFYIENTTSPAIQRKLFYIFSNPWRGGPASGQWDVIVNLWNKEEPMQIALLSNFYPQYSNLSYTAWDLAPINYDEWHELEIEVKLNTPGKYDGETRLWLDGNLIFEKENISIRNESRPLGNVRIGAQIDRNGDINERHEYRYWDDVVISRERIGYMSRNYALCGNSQCETGESCPPCRECCNIADTNFDGKISLQEIINFIGKWKNNKVGIKQMVNALRLWKNGK